MVVMTRHFFKSLIVFAGMIILGLVGVYLVSYFDLDPENQAATETTEDAGCETDKLC
jgi:hypothetical protein